MLVLAFDTATPAVTVALHDGTHVLAETTTVDARRHGELLASSIDAMLAEAGAGRLDITAVAAGTGPGPYTGLRAGLVTARVLGSALGVPVYGVCTLDVIAADVASTGAARGRDFLVATDARRREVTWPATALMAAAWMAPRSATRPTWPRQRPGEREPGERPQPGPQNRGHPDRRRGRAALPGVLGEPIEPSYPVAGTLARIARKSSPRACLAPGPSRSTCAAPTPGCPARRSG